MPTLLERERRSGLVRGAIITYGIAAFGFLFANGRLGAPGVFGSPRSYVIAGLVLQFALLAAHWLIKRRAADQETMLRAYIVLEVIGDGVTVFLFALATLGAILPNPDAGL
ncbi:MAG TPA: hypothetical protein VE046_03610 [Steroidobacteraceae bacterium]|nr:hypothetical protein [Steroidobacteraceae bacterium]